MNKYNLEITYKDICSVTHSVTPSGKELIVELLGGSIIKAYHYEKLPFSIFKSQAKSCNERYEALNKVVTDYLRYTEAFKCGQDLAGRTLKDVETELEAEYDEDEEECEDEEYEEYDEEYEIEEELEGE